MSSALRTKSDRSPLLMTSRYLCTARRISSTKVFQVRGTACASSKYLRGSSEVAEEAAGAFANEVMVVPIGGIPCWIAEKEAAVLASVRFVRERLSGDCKESMEVAGDTPSERYERRRWCYKTYCTLVAEQRPRATRKARASSTIGLTLELLDACVTDASSVSE